MGKSKKDKVVSIHSAPSRASLMFNSRLNVLTTKFAQALETHVDEIIQKAGLDPHDENYFANISSGGYDLRCVYMQDSHMTKYVFVAKEGNLVSGFVLGLDIVNGEVIYTEMNEEIYAELQKSLAEARA